MAGEVPVLVGVDTFYGDVQPVQACINDLQAPLRCQQGSVGGGIYPEYLGGCLGITDHVRKMLVYQRFSFLVKADYPNWVGKFPQAVDNTLVNFEIHGSVASAPGFFHQLRIAGGAELAAEVAGVAGINVDDVGGSQRQGVFQFQPVMDINAGNLSCFHITDTFR